MLSHRTPLLLLIAGYFLSSLPSTAQEEGKVALQFLAFPKQLRPQPVELVVGENKTIEIQTPGNELSPTYEMPRTGTIEVGKTVENEAGEKVFQLYGRSKMISASNQIVLLLRKGEKNSDGFVILPIDGELSEFNGGSYIFINASKINIAGKIGDKRFSLGPGKREMVQPNASHPGGACQVTLAYQREDKWKVFKDTRWTANKRYRSLIFFHQDPVSQRLSVSPIIDMLPFVTPGTG
jgi:hypothetical protein